ncbi:ATP-dependent DNA ligase [Candidatus Dependentiae bacterium]|nr:ATP-dependent DNA ligase [Candidatus Dependentiae bacterium]
MKFSYVAHILEEINKKSSRIEITKILAQLFHESSLQESQIIAYLVTGSLFPAYKTLQFHISHKGVVSLLSFMLDKESSFIEKEFKKYGDFGSLIQQHWQYKDEGLTVRQVYEALVACAEVSGVGSVEKKQHELISLLKKVDAISAQYIVKIVLATLRLGFSDMTIIDSLSWMVVGDKSIRKDIEHAYNICADIGLVALTLKQHGIKGIQDMQIHIGVPIRPAAAERLNSAQEIIEKLGPSIAQPKLDGFRIQVHIKKMKEHDEIHFFSRNLLDMSDMFPEIKKAIKKLEVKSLICEGEAIAFDEDTDTFFPFQETVKRKRKHGVEQVSQDLPLRLYVFDILYLNGHSLLSKTHHERRDMLEKILPQNKESTVQIIDQKLVKNAQELQNYFLKNIEAGLEGLVVKRDDALYQPGKRNFNWIKLKRHARGKLMDTIDAVILGYYAGKGKRAHFGVGAFLVGIYNPQKDLLQTIAKIGTGMNDEEWKDLKKRCDQLLVESKPLNVDVPKELYPDVWIDPKIVCTIQSDEITLSPLHTAGKTTTHAGFALRFPRFISYRFDKSTYDVTSIKEIEDLYKLQKIDKKNID